MNVARAYCFYGSYDHVLIVSRKLCFSGSSSNLCHPVSSSAAPNAKYPSDARKPLEGL